MNDSDAAPLEGPQPRKPADCGVEGWLTFLGHRWTALVLWHLQEGACRHGELAARLPGITAKVLTERLEGLVAHGLVRRQELLTYPRGVRYTLSSTAMNLLPVLGQLELWSRSAAAADTKAPWPHAAV